MLGDGRSITSRTVVLATGKHELRGHHRICKPGPGWVGFKMHWRLSPDQQAALGQQIELFLHPDGYAGLQPIDAGLANLCFVLGVSAFQTSGATFAAALARLRQLLPRLDERLRGATPLWATAPSVAGLPYGYLCRARDCSDGLYRIGDQLAVIPSFTGEGIAIALRTARLAAEAIMAGVPPREFVATVRRHVHLPMRLAASLEALTRRHVLARPALSFARYAGVLPILARGTRLPVRQAGNAWPVWSGPQSLTFRGRSAHYP
jgi:flavin-dependent dehydrogenase